MPFLIASVLMANDVFGPLEDFEPGQVLETISGAQTVREAAESLGLLAVLTEANAENLGEFLDTIPASLDAAVLAAVRSALQRGVRVQLTWQPAYEFEVRMWEVTETTPDGTLGLVNINVLSQHPPEEPELL